jgi:hypothetical protein
MAAYEDAIRATSARKAPWYVVPADHKWFARLIVGRVILDALEHLDLDYPKVEGGAEALERIGALLEADGFGDHTQARKRFPSRKSR